MKSTKKAERLGKFISYILCRKPEEFGLIPDQNGWVKIKELLKAICEEDGWRYVRKSHINEILLTLKKPPIEIKDAFIRAKNRDELATREIVEFHDLPKLLYSCVRQRAYPHVLEKGLSPAGTDYVIMSKRRKMAERIGKRNDQAPVLLTIQVKKSFQKGASFKKAGEMLYLTDYIAPDCFTGPPLPKEKEEIKKQAKAKKDETPKISGTPGSFLLDASDDMERRKRTRLERKRKEIPWKKERKRLKRQKRIKGFQNI